MKIYCNKPRFCDYICHNWLLVGWVFAILVLWRLCFCFDSTGFTAMTSLSRKRIIIMPNTNDNKLGECSICIVPAVSYVKSRACAEILKSISIFCEIRLFKEFMSSRKKHRSEIQKYLILRNTPQRWPITNTKVVWPLVFFQSVNTFESFCEVIVTQTLQSKA